MAGRGGGGGELKEEKDTDDVKLLSLQFRYDFYNEHIIHTASHWK